MKGGESLDRLATQEEVIQAIESLSDEDFYRLRKAASFCLMGSDYIDLDEIINEAICRTLHGERNWPKSVPFIAYMIQTMKGLSSDSRDSLQRSRTKQLEALAPDGVNIEEVMGRLDQRHPDPLTNLIEVEVNSERQVRAKVDSDRIEVFFAEDAQVTWLILGIKEESSPADIMELSGMTQTQYDTARRRFRRGVAKIFSEKRPS